MIPVGWMILAILGMFTMTALAAAGRFAAGGLDPVPGGATAREVSPSLEPTPTVEPAPTAEKQEMCPSSWKVWKVKNPAGIDYYDASPEVKGCIKRRFLELYRAMGPKHIDEFDPDRAVELGIRPPDRPVTEVTVVRYGRRAILVTGFSTDGFRCCLRDYNEGGALQVYTWPGKELIREERLPDQVIFYYMAYRPWKGDWFLVGAQPGEPASGTNVPLPRGIPDCITIESGGLVEEEE